LKILARGQAQPEQEQETGFFPLFSSFLFLSIVLIAVYINEEQQGENEGEYVS
jgi:hypothetical protein